MKYGLTYFNKPYTHPKVDIIREWQYSKKRFFSQEFYTLFVDLNESPKNIFSSLKKNTQYEIKRSKNRDNVDIKTLSPLDENRQLFYDFYNEFAATKNLESIGTKEVDLLIENNMFTVRSAFYNGEIIVCHSYFTVNERARLAHSASLFRESLDNSQRSLIGRANRLLHWEDILYFKELGFITYDFGGVNMDLSNKETLAINQFKECFGGTLIKEYKSLVPVSFKGFLYLLAKKLAGKI